MSDTIITVENLSKCYLVGHRFAQDERGVTFREMLEREARNVTRQTLDLVRGRKIIQGDQIEQFWALKNVSFDVKQGEVLGIIGRNGAGKSTLLKILSRITEPTEGRVTISGRVASLLEVGTGFHQELTGRENIYLNGAILGLSKKEIRRKFDEIVAFAEVDKFLDTPMKRYSSGMYMRLAFAVAAHLEAEILMVDEVLAVGDAEFQKKCMGKMQDVTKQGRTILFISHNIGAINHLCDRSLLFDRGKLVKDGASDIVTRWYLSNIGFSTPSKLEERHGDATFLSASLENDAGEHVSLFDIGSPIKLRMRFRLNRRIPGLQVAISVFNEMGSRIFFHSNAYATPPQIVENVGTHSILAIIPRMLLVPGAYSINIALHVPNQELFDHREHILLFDLRDLDSGQYDFSPDDIGFVFADIHWKICS